MPAGAPSTARRVASWAGETLVTLGVIVGLFLAYDLWWTGRDTAAAQRDLGQAWARDGDPGSGTGAGGGPRTTGHGVPADPDAPDARDGRRVYPGPPAAPRLGDAVAVLHIPRLGGAWRWFVVEGTTLDDLALGPGHYRNTALPGRRGNFAVAGHRATHGQPFADLDRVGVGDTVIAETHAAWYVYQVDRARVVAPDSWAAIAPVPWHPGRRADRAYLTLTTCDPRWGSTHRLILTGHLLRAIPHDEGPPAGVDRTT